MGSIGADTGIARVVDVFSRFFLLFDLSLSILVLIFVLIMGSSL